MTGAPVAASQVGQPTGVTPPASAVRTGWQRAAEVAGIVAAGMLGAAGVIPW